MRRFCLGPFSLLPSTDQLLTVSPLILARVGTLNNDQRPLQGNHREFRGEASFALGNSSFCSASLWILLISSQLFKAL